MSGQTSEVSSVTPRHLGLTRRQSYDPLSTTKSSPLTLGALPSPAFGRLPTGQRSVPAVESNRLSVGGGGSAYRTGLTGSGEEPRTPGGSLVVGSEVFGFGRTPTVIEARERWGNGGEESDEKDGVTPKGGEADPTKWPSDYDGSVTGQGSDFRSDNGGRSGNGRVETADMATHNVSWCFAAFRSGSDENALVRD